jgi:hypothetical protein
MGMVRSHVNALLKPERWDVSPGKGATNSLKGAATAWREKARFCRSGCQNFPHSTAFSGATPTLFVIPLKLFSLTPILGHHLRRPSD